MDKEVKKQSVEERLIERAEMRLSHNTMLIEDLDKVKNNEECIPLSKEVQAHAMKTLIGNESEFLIYIMDMLSLNKATKEKFESIDKALQATQPANQELTLPTGHRVDMIMEDRRKAAQTLWDLGYDYKIEDPIKSLTEQFKSIHKEWFALKKAKEEAERKVQEFETQVKQPEVQSKDRRDAARVMYDLSYTYEGSDPVGSLVGHFRKVHNDWYVLKKAKEAAENKVKELEAHAQTAVSDNTNQEKIDKPGKDAESNDGWELSYKELQNFAAKALKDNGINGGDVNPVRTLEKYYRAANHDLNVMKRDYTVLKQNYDILEGEKLKVEQKLQDMLKFNRKLYDEKSELDIRLDQAKELADTYLKTVHSREQDIIKLHDQLELLKNVGKSNVQHLNNIATLNDTLSKCELEAKSLQERLKDKEAAYKQTLRKVDELSMKLLQYEEGAERAQHKHNYLYQTSDPLKSLIENFETVVKNFSSYVSANPPSDNATQSIEDQLKVCKETHKEHSNKALEVLNKHRLHYNKNYPPVLEVIRHLGLYVEYANSLVNDLTKLRGDSSSKLILLNDIRLLLQSFTDGKLGNSNTNVFIDLKELFRNGVVSTESFNELVQKHNNLISENEARKASDGIDYKTTHDKLVEQAKEIMNKHNLAYHKNDVLNHALGHLDEYADVNLSLARNLEEAREGRNHHFKTLNAIRILIHDVTNQRLGKHFSQIEKDLREVLEYFSQIEKDNALLSKCQVEYTQKIAEAAKVLEKNGFDSWPGNSVSKLISDFDKVCNNYEQAKERSLADRKRIDALAESDEQKYGYLEEIRKVLIEYDSNYGCDHPFLARHIRNALKLCKESQEALKVMLENRTKEKEQIKVGDTVVLKESLHINGRWFAKGTACRVTTAPTEYSDYAAIGLEISSTTKATLGLKDVIKS